MATRTVIIRSLAVGCGAELHLSLASEYVKSLASTLSLFCTRRRDNVSEKVCLISILLLSLLGFHS